MPEKTPLRVACVMMQRNEDRCLAPWITYHTHLFGIENLFVIDHGSDDPGVKATLARLASAGGKVVPLPATADFRQKGSFISAALARVDAMRCHDLLLPLDCDEFVMIRDENGAPNCTREVILNYLASLRGIESPLLVAENFLNTQHNPEGFWPQPYRKVFFTGGHAGAVDGGAHHCTSTAMPEVITRVAYAHYHHKPYAVQLKMSREKLRAYVDVEDRAALAAYRGIGWHLVAHVLKTEAEYSAGMTEGSLRIPALAALFTSLGINPRFCMA
jgi:hypothetical protein